MHPVSHVSPFQKSVAAFGSAIILFLGLGATPLSAIQWDYTWTPGASESGAAAQTCSLKYGKRWAYTIELDDGDLATGKFAPDFFSNYRYTDAPPGIPGGKSLPVVGSLMIFAYRTGANSLFMGFDDLRWAVGKGWAIGNHSYFHKGKDYAPYEILTPREFRETLFWNQLILATEVGNGRAPTHFAYPNGYDPYKDWLAEFGLVSASSYGCPEINLNPPGGDMRRFHRRLLDEGNWSGANGLANPLYDLAPGGPADHELVIDFTHGLDTNTASSNHLRWKARLSNYIVPRGAGGLDEFWSAPTEDIVNYFLAAKASTATLSPGHLSVSFPDAMPGTPLTVKLTGIPADTALPIPPGGALYRSGTTAWVTSPMIGLKGVATPDADLKRVYLGAPTNQINLTNVIQFGGIRIKQLGRPASNYTLAIDLVLTDGTVSNWIRTNQKVTWYAFYDLFTMIPEGAGPLVKAVRLSQDPYQKEVEIWGKAEAVKADTTAPKVQGDLPNFTTNAPFVLNLSVDENDGWVSTNGTVFRSFPAGSTNLTIDRTTQVWTFGRDGAGNVSATNERLYTLVAPTTPVAGVTPTSLLTNRSFTCTLTAIGDMGYWSTNGAAGPYTAYPTAGTNLGVASSTAVWYYATFGGQRSVTNMVQYGFDVTAPVVTGAPARFTTNAPFRICLSVNEPSGYWSTNGAPFAALSTNGCEIDILKTTSLAVFGRDSLGNTGTTNQFLYTLEVPVPVSASNTNAAYSDLSQATALGSPFSGTGPGIRFVGLTPKTILKVFTLSGKFVIQVKPSSQDPVGTLLWTARTPTGAPVADGVYLCVLSDPAVEKKVIRVMVTR